MLPQAIHLLCQGIPLLHVAHHDNPWKVLADKSSIPYYHGLHLSLSRYSPCLDIDPRRPEPRGSQFDDLCTLLRRTRVPGVGTQADTAQQPTVIVRPWLVCRQS